MGGPYHGKSAAFYKGSYNLSGMSTNLTLAQNVATAEKTCFGDSAQSHAAGVPGWQATVSSLWDDTTTTGTADVYTAALGTGGVISFYPAGTTIGYRGRGGQSELETDFAVTSPVAGMVTAEVTLKGNGALEGLRCLGASSSTVTASAAFTGVDYSASSTSQTLAGYLHVTAIAGTDPSVAVVIQESSDNTTYTDLLSFTAATAVTSERKTTSSSVARYVRAKYTPNASTTSFTLAVGFHRDEPV